MKKIALVAACDRYNYGDVLMPILFEEYYRINGEQASFNYFALSNADLRPVGGRITEPLYQIDESYQYVIFVGGEILTPSYRGMYLNLQKNKLWIKILGKASTVYFPLVNWFCKVLMHGKYKNPWTFFAKSQHQHVLYNSVGGQEFSSMREKNKDEIIELIKKSDLFSVRDNRTRDSILEYAPGIRIDMIPDTAIIMSRIYSRDYLHTHISNAISEALRSINSYYVIQVNKVFGMGLTEEIASAFKEIYNKTGMKCLLMPISIVQGHEDDIPLKIIASKCPIESCYIGNTSILDIMHIIANARAFVGTSLHGIITAASYCVPHSTITPNCLKLRSFIKSWGTSTVEYVEGEQGLIDYILEENILLSVNNDRIYQMQENVQDYFNSIIEMIDRSEEYYD